MDDLVNIARNGFCGDKCRVMKAELGCTCAEFADRIESQSTEIAELNSLLSGLLALIHRDGGHYESRYGRKKAVADAMEKVPNEYLTAADEVAELRAQLSRMIDPAKMLRWEGRRYYIGNLQIGGVYSSEHRSPGGWRWVAALSLEGFSYTESKARADVKRAVLEALGVKT